MDYLVEEILQRQTGDVQDFLLKTSVLEKPTASLCDAITGRTDSRELLRPSSGQTSSWSPSTNPGSGSDTSTFSPTSFATAWRPSSEMKSSPTSHAGEPLVQRQRLR